MTYDVIIRAGMLIGPEGPRQVDLAVSDGRIALVAPEIAGDAAEIIDAAGLHLFPGGIDPHVHFNEPGRADWEGWASGTQALAAGGVTTCFEMPLNAHPPTLDGASFDAKLAAAQAVTVADFALWGGLTPLNLEHMEELAERGVIGFKAFMSRSGTDDFPAADDASLYEGMVRAARLGRLVAVHAENDQLTARLAERAIAHGRVTALDYLRSRPVIAEVEAIGRAIMFAEEAGCALHIVHVSTGRGVQLVAEARARGVDVSCETCPHYLVLTDDDLEALGAVAKCAPPLRSAGEQAALWQHILDGSLPMVSSDHSPAPPDMKTGENFFGIWGGISGCQSTLPLLLTEGYERRGLSLAAIGGLTSWNVARRFGVAPAKGRLVVGADADVALVHLDRRAVMRAEELRYRHRQSPYVGRELRGVVVRTLLRGMTVFRDGLVTERACGRLVTPTTPASTI